MGPLEGIRVVELGEGIASPVAGMFFSDYGAEVVKVVPRGEEQTRSMPGHVVWDRGKRSVALRVEAPHGREALLRLLDRCDVLLESLPPGEAERLGIGYPALRDGHPRLVYCSISGYDTNGPDAGRPAYDGLVEARVGFMTNEWGGGERRPGPKRMGFAAPSYAAAFFACMGVLTALYVRNETGRGQYVEASLFGGAAAMSRWGWAERPGPVTPPGRSLFGIWQCADGEYVWTHTGARGSFDRYMRVLGLEEYMVSAPDPLPWTPERTRELRERMTKIMASKPRAEWTRLFDAADCPNQPTLPPGRAFDDAQTRAVEMVATVNDPVLGMVEQVGVPIKFEKTPGKVKGPAPLWGQHTQEVLAEVGFAPHEIDTLRGEGVI